MSSDQFSYKQLYLICRSLIYFTTSPTNYICKYQIDEKKIMKVNHTMLAWCHQINHMEPQNE